MFREPQQCVYSCDRCGGFFAYEERFADRRHPHDPNARNVIERKVPAERGILGYNAVDLCGNCMADYAVWLVPTKACAACESESAPKAASVDTSRESK